MSPHKSQLVACGGEVVVAATCNVATVGDVVAAIGVAAARNATAASDVAAAIGVAASDDVVVVVGVAATVVVWVQRCLMRPCTSPQFAFVSVVVTPTGEEPSWWDR